MAPKDGGFTCNNYGKPSIFSSGKIVVDVEIYYFLVAAYEHRSD